MARREIEKEISIVLGDLARSGSDSVEAFLEINVVGLNKTRSMASKRNQNRLAKYPQCRSLFPS
jgi:hypothetical protein